MIEDLSGAWEVRRAASTDVLEEAGADGEWLGAEVPGCVHLDLMRADQIPDPFYGFNDLQVQWVAEAHWLYRRTFDCPKELRNMRAIELVCKGLDTFAQVFLNGKEVGRADNMFREWRWDVTGMPNAKGNELLVLFESPNQAGDALLAEHGPLPVRAGVDPRRTYIRKAQCASGWDWGPSLNTCGIWRLIHLEGHGAGRISDVCVRVDWADPKVPVVKVAVELQAGESCAARIGAQLAGFGHTATARCSPKLKPGGNLAELSIAVKDPQLWWPAGFGPQNLYQLTVSAKLNDEEVDSVSLNVGLRQAELRREKDEEGESFVICVNGEPVFCRGADWIPADSFIPRATREKYESLLQKAADANMNMLRVWGGGIYEQDELYDACDRLGIMVWQDFMFACAGYPDRLDWFRQSVRAEAECNVRRLRNHPCVMLWCGCNENQMFYEREGDWPGRRLYEEVLPEVCEELDPTRPYWPGSPYGGRHPNAETEGNQHFWDPWYAWEHADVQRNYNGRFISEFGFEAPPAPETIRDYIPAGGHELLSRAMEHHNRCYAGTERMLRHLGSFFRLPASFVDVVYLLQLTQAEAIKIGVEHWRSRKFLTAGTLFWQFNDCWPGTSWSCVDYEHRPKALYYYARRFFAPVLPVIERRDGTFTVRVVNDRREDFKGELICGFGSLRGDQHWVQRRAISIPANAVAVAQQKSEDGLDLTEPERRYFWCRLIEGTEEIARNSHMLLPYKHMEFEPPEWEVWVEKEDECRFALNIGNSGFAKGVWLREEGIEAEFSDNFFDLFPEVHVRVRLKTASDMSAGEVHRRLRVRSAVEARQASEP